MSKFSISNFQKKLYCRAVKIHVCMGKVYSNSFIKVPIAANKKEFVYIIKVKPIHTILKYGDYHDFMDRLWCSSQKFQSMAIKKMLKIK